MPDQPSKADKRLEVLSRLGTAKIAGLTCNKNAPMTVRLDVQIPVENLQEAITVLGLEATDLLMNELTAALTALKAAKK